MKDLHDMLAAGKDLRFSLTEEQEKDVESDIVCLDEDYRTAVTASTGDCAVQGLQWCLACRSGKSLTRKYATGCAVRRF